MAVPLFVLQMCTWLFCCILYFPGCYCLWDLERGREQDWLWLHAGRNKFKVFTCLIQWIYCWIAAYFVYSHCIASHWHENCYFETVSTVLKLCRAPCQCMIINRRQKLVEFWLLPCCRTTLRRCGETCTGTTGGKAQKWMFDWFLLSQSPLFLLVSLYSGFFLCDHL